MAVLVFIARVFFAIANAWPSAIATTQLGIVVPICTDGDIIVRALAQQRKLGRMVGVFKLPERM
jgi:hypothetical protein